MTSLRLFAYRLGLTLRAASLYRWRDLGYAAAVTRLPETWAKGGPISRLIGHGLDQLARQHTV